MTVLNTADWLLSCSTPSSATSMSNPSIMHVCGRIDDLLCWASDNLLYCFCFIAAYPSISRNLSINIVQRVKGFLLYFTSIYIK